MDGLQSRDIPYFRFNTEFDSSDSQYALHISSTDGQFLLSCDGKYCALSDVRAAWFQQPPPDQDQSTALDSIRLRSRTTTLVGALYSLDCPWVNHPDAAKNASNKVIQLMLAKRHGLHFPETLISNNPHEVREFFALRSPIVAKSIGSQWLQVNDQLLAAYTQEVHESWLAKSGDISFAPVIYQRFFDRKRDFRVVVVGNRAFAAVCEHQSAHQKFDVRRDSPAHSYRPSEFPEHHLNRLRALMNDLCIEYCSADFFETTNDELVFIDLNVTGSWWWVDELHGGEICKALVALLARKAGYE